MSRDIDTEFARLALIEDAAKTTVTEMLKLGYGASKEKPLPGTFDTLLESLAPWKP